jgi:hypothetical protein
MLQGTVAGALATPEIDWTQPRPDGWLMGGGWGSQRTVLFSGLRWVRPWSRQAAAGPCDRPASAPT